MILTKLSSAHKKEFLNYFKFIIKKFGILYFLNALFQFGLVRLLHNKIPKEYQDLKKQDEVSLKYEKKDIRSTLPIARSFLKNKTWDKYNLNLARKSIPLKIEKFWDADFDDIEDNFSLHRFGWLFHLYSGNSDIEILKTSEQLILEWITLNPCDDKIGWDSYSISERVVNWSYFLLLAKPYSFPEKEHLNIILKSLIGQLEFLSHNLEFRYTGTNNHLINNGRAMYLAGALLDIKSATSLGREILLACSKKMFASSGFLNEGSSHYQALMARTYFEVYLCAHAIKDEPFLKSIEPVTKRIIECASYFSQGQSFPFLGDISPDCFPEFHMDWLESLKTNIEEDASGKFHKLGGWGQFFNQRVPGQIKGILPHSSKAEQDFIAYPDAGHYRFKNNVYSLFVYANPMGYVPEWSHGHSDVGGFVLYWEGLPVFVDVGRYSFQQNSLGLYGRSVRSHNSISLDGYEPCVTHGLNGYAQLMSEKYTGPAPKVSCVQEDNAMVINVEFYGFSRIWSNTVISRAFICESDRLIIEDTLSGEGSRSIESFFHLHPDVEVKEKFGDSIEFSFPDKWNLLFDVEKTSNTSLETYNGCLEPNPAGWYFPKYGKKVPTNTLIVTEKTKLPFKRKYCLCSE